MLFRYAVVAVTLLCFTACTSMQPIEDITPATIRQQVQVDDEVHIVLRSGAVYDLVVTKVEEDSLVGEADSGKHWRIKYDAIRSIESEQGSAGKTAGLVGGAAVLLYAAVLVVGVLALFEVVDGD
jgi:hypothetical protein